MYRYARTAAGRTCGILACVSFCASFVSTAFAQDAGSLLREQQRQEQRQTPLRLPEAERPAAAPVLPPAEGEETVLVRTLRFAGKTELLPEAERARIAAAVIGKRLGIAGLRALADEVTAALQRQGRLLAHAVLPPQDVTDGTVTIEIVEGSLERIELHRDAGVRAAESRLRALLGTPLTPSKDELEEALLRLNDHPGVTARARLAPGAAPGTSRLVVDVTQAPRFDAHLLANNFGSSATGREQAGAVMPLTDLTGYGDLMRLSGVFSEGQRYSSITGSLPLGASGVVASASYGYLDYRNVDSTGRLLGLEGHAHYVSGGLDYAVVRSRQQNVRIGAEFQWKALIDDSDLGRLQNKRVRSLTLKASGDVRNLFFGTSITDWSLGWSFGELDLSRVPAALAADRAGLRTHGHFQRVSVGASHLQQLSGAWSLYGRVEGQWADRNLDSSEQFTLGGPYGVRGWPVGEARGDLGVLGSLELRYDTAAPAGWGSLQYAAFLDGGHIRLNKDSNGIDPLNACDCNQYALGSAGVALRWSAQRFYLAATYAHRIGGNGGRSALTGENVDGKKRKDQFWVHGVVRF